MAEREVGRSPVLIIGTHRSGTSALTRALARLGLFTGWRRDSNDEALLFLSLNEWLLREADAAWHRPAPLRALLRDAELRGAAGAAVEKALRGWTTLGYLGPRRFAAAHASLRAGLREPWGWKDPRSTISLPMWLELYPSAHVLAVARHGVDVAASLVRREERRRPFAQPARLSVLGLTSPSPAPPRPALDLARAFAIWEEYEDAAQEAERLAGERFLRVRYEALAARPLDVLPEVARFCGLAPGAAALDEAAGTLRAEGTSRRAQDPALAAFAASASARLARFGY